MAHQVSSDRVPVFSLGERIRKAREDLGLSQQAFADLLGVDRKTVSNWEGGRNRPRYGDLMLIASVTDVSLVWLAGNEFRIPIPAGRGEAAAGGGRQGIDNSRDASRDTHEYPELSAELAAA